MKHLKTFESFDKDDIKKFILQFINYASTGETLRYLKNLPEESINIWKDAFQKLNVEKKNAVYNAIAEFLENK
jgi:hypothetical protein